MATVSGGRLQGMLQAAVQSVQWTYSLFWQPCPQQGILVWGDGYYNGAIKTRKTVQPMEVTAEEASLQRSQQLRELYDSLSAAETDQPVQRPCAALSPEDLTETEWFYLMCVSFSFPPGVGLPGKAYSRRQHVWLTGANEVDSETFSRAILARSARIQTVVCIPLLDGVVEFGTTEKVQEDVTFIQHIKGFFMDYLPPPPKPALSEHSTSNHNPSKSASYQNFHSPCIPALYTLADPPANPNDIQNDEDEEEEEEEDEDDENMSNSEEVETTRNNQNPQFLTTQAVEASELMQLEMSEDIRVGSPDDLSNNLESELHMSGNPPDRHHRVDPFGEETTRRCPSTLMQDSTLSARFQLPPSGLRPPEELSHEDTHYSQTVSDILQSQRMTSDSTINIHAVYSTQSAFAQWTNRSEPNIHVNIESTSQWLLKYILFSVPYLHKRYSEENSPKSRDSDGVNRLRKSVSQDELSANHVLAERRRREKLNERFIILRSLVPFVTKMDKASILGDTIEYVKQLRKKIQDLETRNCQLQLDQKRVPLSPCGGSLTEKTRKMRIVEGSDGGTAAKTVETDVMEGEVETNVDVSIIESDALLEMQCRNREGLLLDIMQLLREMRMETTTVQCSSSNGVFVAELRAKVKDNVNWKRVSIMEVKRAINQVIPHH